MSDPKPEVRQVQLTHVPTEAVPIRSVEVAPTIIHLSDGSVLQLTPQVAEVQKATNQKDPNGNPIYLVTSQASISVIKAEASR